MQPVEVYRLYLAKDTPAKRDNVIRAAWKANNEDFFEGLAMSMDPTPMPFTSVPEIQEEEDDDFEFTFTFREFRILMQQLPTMTPDEAKEALVDAAMSANAVEWNHWYRKILLKNLTASMDVERLIELLKKLTQ